MNLGHAFQLARQASEAGDRAALLRVLQAAATFAPSDPFVLYNLARAEALTGDQEGALRTLERLAPQGAARDVTADTAFAALRALPRFQAVARRLATRAVPIVRSDTAFVLTDPDFIPEGIAFDSVAGAFYVGSLHRHKVVRVTREGAVSDFTRPRQDELGQVLGLHVDAVRRRLWLATSVPDSAAPRYSDGSGGWAALHVYDLATGRLLGRYTPPDRDRPHLLNDIALTPGGDVYVTDSEGNGLYRLRSGGDGLERIYGGVGHFTYPNGITLAPNGTHLYVAHMEGVSAVELASVKVTRVEAPAGVTTGGIDGLYACPGGLIGVQGMLGFHQIAWLALVPDGHRITEVRPLERRHPAHDVPTTGTLAGDTFHYIANSQLGRLGSNGVLTPATSKRGTVVLRLPLHAACGRP